MAMAPANRAIGISHRNVPRLWGPVGGRVVFECVPPPVVGAVDSTGPGVVVGIEVLSTGGGTVDDEGVVVVDD
jgi:hypothetical protein